jgi:hypothetical protein
MDAAGNIYGDNMDGSLYEISPPPTQLAFGSAPVTAVAQTNFGPAVTVNVENFPGSVDVADNSIVTLTIASGPPGVALGGTVSAMAVNGVATFSNLSIYQAGTYTLTATDDALTSATSAPFNVTAAYAPSPIVPRFGNVSLPVTAVAGFPLKARMPVVIANPAGAFKGEVLINVYADAQTTLTGNQVLIASVTKNVSLKQGKSEVVNLSIKSLPSTLTAGNYHLLAEVIDPFNARSLTATAQTFEVKVGGVTPAKISQGKFGSILVTVTNTGNQAARGVDITLSPSTDGVAPVDGFVLENIQSHATIQPNQSKTFRLHFTISPALAAGTYFPYVSVSMGIASATAAGTSLFVYQPLA